MNRKASGFCTSMGVELHGINDAWLNPADWAFRLRSGERGRAPSESEAQCLSALFILGGHISLRYEGGCETSGWAAGDEDVMWKVAKARRGTNACRLFFWQI
ncbi:hypothetical protein N7486_000144 [Penicillium sp. IBT 16267x]|nr:hypothetical protein N7486_000144 [Penicillium sp. IBT 16267x]